jgi:hypothetical protein
LQIKTKNVSSHTADSKPVKQEVNGTVILPPLVFPDNAKHNDIQYDSKFNAILSIMAVSQIYFQVRWEEPAEWILEDILEDMHLNSS